MEPRRPRSPVSLFYVTPEPPRPKNAGRGQDGGSVFTGSSRGSSTIKASRSHLFRFSKPKAGDDREKKKSSDPLVGSSGHGSGLSVVAPKSGLNVPVESKGKGKDGNSTVDPIDRRGDVTNPLTPAAEYLMLQLGNVPVDSTPSRPPPLRSSSSPDPNLATVSSLALQDLMSPRNPRPDRDIGAQVHALTKDSDDHRFIRELEAAAVDVVPAWLTLDGDLAPRSIGIPLSQGNVSPVASSYLSASEAGGDDRLSSRWSDEDGVDSSNSEQEEAGDHKSHKSMRSHARPVGTHRQTRDNSSINSGTRSIRPSKPMRPPPTIPLPSRPLSPTSTFRQELYPSPPGSNHGGFPPYPFPLPSPVSVSFPHRPSKTFADDQSGYTHFFADDASEFKTGSSPKLYPASLRGEEGQRTELEQRVGRLEKEARERERKLSELLYRLDLGDARET